jgi:hypothetical protein
MEIEFTFELTKIEKPIFNIRVQRYTSQFKDVNSLIFSDIDLMPLPRINYCPSSARIFSQSSPSVQVFTTGI